MFECIILYHQTNGDYMSFRANYRHKYPAPCPEFVEKLFIPYCKAKELTIVDPYLLVLGMKPRQFSKVRNEIADYNYNKHLEYVTSPESETYRAS